MNVDISVSRDCVNIYSYGELCIGCGCCSRNPDCRNMIVSRIRYYKQRLHDNQHIDNWAEDERWRKHQEKVVKSNILFYKRKIRLNKKILRTLK